MKVAILGGTGNLGLGLAVRLARTENYVIIGSRELKKAQKRADVYNKILEKLGSDNRIEGLQNEDAARKADISIFTIPWKHAFSTAEQLKVALSEKIVVSPLVPMEKKDGPFLFTPPPEGSAAEKLANILENSKVVSAFHNIPAAKFANFDEKFEFDVVVCGDDEAKHVVIELINKIDGLRALDGGPLIVSRMVESVTPLLLNIAAMNKMKDLSIKFI